MTSYQVSKSTSHFNFQSIVFKYSTVIYLLNKLFYQPMNKCLLKRDKVVLPGQLKLFWFYRKKHIPVQRQIWSFASEILEVINLIYHCFSLSYIFIPSEIIRHAFLTSFKSSFSEGHFIKNSFGEVIVFRIIFLSLGQMPFKNFGPTKW